MINHYLFGSKLTKSIVVEYNKPVMIPAGVDILQYVPAPTNTSNSSGIKGWKDAWAEMFTLNKETTTIDTIDLSKYKERMIDAVRFEKEYNIHN